MIKIMIIVKVKRYINYQSCSTENQFLIHISNKTKRYALFDLINMSYLITIKMS